MNRKKFFGIILILSFAALTVMSISPVASAIDPTAYANAILADPSTLVSSSATGNDLEFYVYTSPVGYLTATDGSTFLLMSTGRADALPGVPSTEANTDLPPAGVIGDNASLTLTLLVPAGVNALRFDYRFMSDEYPQYTVNDYFHAILNDSSGSHQLAFDSLGREIGVGNNVFDPSIATTGTVFNGATPQITNRAAVVPGETITLTFEIGDAMDGLYDTAVFIDNVRFYSGADNLPPVTTDDYDGFWHTSNFTINLSASDATGISETYYIINKGATKNVTLGGQPQISMEGNNSLEYWSIDTNGFVEYPHNSLTGIGLDMTAPTGSISIDNGTLETASPQVTLNLTYSDAISGVSQVQYSNDGSSWSGWENATATKAWTLSAGGGEKTVYYQIADKAGLTTTVSDTINYSNPDITPPTGTISINGGNAYTNSASVTLALTYEDDMSGVNQVRYSNDDSTWSSWESPVASKEWTLLSGDGNNTVYFQIEDNAGLTTNLSSSIMLDMTPPNANAGRDQSVTRGQSISFDGSASSDASGIVSYVWSFGDGSPQEYGKTTVHRYSVNGYYTAKLTVTDAAGNTATSTASIYVHSPASTPTPTPTPTVTPTPTPTPTLTPQPTATQPPQDQTTTIIFVIIGGALIIGLISGIYAFTRRRR